MGNAEQSGLFELEPAVRSQKSVSWVRLRRDETPAKSRIYIAKTQNLKF